MNVGSLDLLLIGIPAVILGAAAVILLVRRELAAAAGISGASRWILAAAFGMGVIAFAVKLAAFAVISAVPPKVMTALMVDRKYVEIRKVVRTDDGFDYVTGAESGPYVWQPLPLYAPAPADNPTTPEKAALGKRLFFDTNLSSTREVACASCHDVEHGGGVDGRRTSKGIKGQIGGRNAPTVWNAAFQTVMFWDGRAGSLEEQAKGPPLNPIEMGMPSAEAVAQRVRDDASYREPFARIFGEGVEITMDRIAQAIAAYERTLITPDAPYDRFVRGDEKALSQSQLRGMALFQTTGCVLCHMGPNFSASSVMGDANPYRLFPTNTSSYEKRYNLTADTGALPAGSSRGLWRVPSLRNVALTGPYFHNGSVDTLEEAVRIMATVQLNASIGEEPHRGRRVFWSAADQTLSAIDGPVLSNADVRDIVEFLKALTSDQLSVPPAGKQPRSVPPPDQHHASHHEGHAGQLPG
jgi:cytochrome c peroxidase